MSKRIMMSLLVSCMQLSGMENVGDLRNKLFSIISADGKKIPLLYEHARHMSVFFPFRENRCAFLSRHNAETIKTLLEFVKKIDDKTINESYFPVQYFCDINPVTTNMSLDKYKSFDHNLDQKQLPNRDVIELMSLARELKDEQLVITLTSFFIEKKYHKNMFSALMTSAQLLSFQQQIDAIVERNYQPKLKEDKDFTDFFAVTNQVDQVGIANSSRTLVAILDDEKKNRIFIKKIGGITVAVLEDAGKGSFSSPTFSGDDSTFACIQNISATDCHSFILFVWDVARWKLLGKALFSSAGNVRNMSLNHTGTRLVASVQTADRLSPQAKNYTCKYENIIIDIGQKGARISERIPVRAIESLMYYRSDATFVTSSDPRIFYQWFFTKIQEKDKDLNFLQMIFLYGLYERMQAVKSPIAPLLSGYVKKYIVESLPKKLSNWAQEVQEKYKFQS